MTLLLVDGFEDFTSWTNASSTLVAGRNGNCANCGSSSQTLTYTIPAASESDTVTIGFAFRATAGTLASNTTMLQLKSDSNATLHIAVQVAADGTLSAARNGITGVASSAAGTIVANTWQYIEAQIKLHDTTGSVTLRVNSIVVATATNVDTKNAGTKTTFDTVRFAGASVSTVAQFDDFYLMTGSGDPFLGDCKVETLYPASDVTAQWVGSDGNSTDNYLLVDETGTPNVADYVGSPTSGNKDLYTLTDLVSTTGTIAAVQHHVWGAKTDAGAIQFYIVNNSTTDNLSAALTPTTSYADYSYTLTSDPEGGSWTITKVNALRAGVKVV